MFFFKLVKLEDSQLVLDDYSSQIDYNFVRLSDLENTEDFHDYLQNKIFENLKGLDEKGIELYHQA